MLDEEDQLDIVYLDFKKVLGDVLYISYHLFRQMKTQHTPNLQRIVVVVLGKSSIMIFTWMLWIS